MKKIKSVFRLIKVLTSGGMPVAWFQIVEGIMKFATEVQQHGKPMLTKIAAVNMRTDAPISEMDIVSIWAGVGEANPIERIKHLKAQNTAMKELLEKCRGTFEVGRNNDLILNIKIVLDTFE